MTILIPRPWKLQVKYFISYSKVGIWFSSVFTALFYTCSLIARACKYAFSQSFNKINELSRNQLKGDFLFSLPWNFRIPFRTKWLRAKRLPHRKAFVRWFSTMRGRLSTLKSLFDIFLSAALRSEKLWEILRTISFSIYINGYKMRTQKVKCIYVTANMINPVLMNSNR